MKTLRERIEASVLTIGALAVAASVQISASPKGPAEPLQEPAADVADRTIPGRPLRAEERLCLIGPALPTSDRVLPLVPGRDGSTEQRLTPSFASMAASGVRPTSDVGGPELDCLRPSTGP